MIYGYESVSFKKGIISPRKLPYGWLKRHIFVVLTNNIEIVFALILGVAKSENFKIVDHVFRHKLTYKLMVTIDGH